ncbi:hypothetical protein OESDEN_22006, partial [Oesophagostomum dentatum]
NGSIIKSAFPCFLEALLESLPGHYDSKGFPSAGLLPFLHSFLCSFSNTCHLSPTTGDEKQFIHNGTDPHESILVDLLYYSSLQLGWIGEHPTEFSLLLGEFTKLISVIARMNSTEPPKARQYFDPSFNLNETLMELGISENAASLLADSVPTPEFFMHSFAYGRELTSLSPMELALTAFTSVPILCNETIFSESFLRPPK